MAFLNDGTTNQACDLPNTYHQLLLCEADSWLSSRLWQNNINLVMTTTLGEFSLMAMTTSFSSRREAVKQLNGWHTNIIPILFWESKIMFLTWNLKTAWASNWEKGCNYCSNLTPPPVCQVKAVVKLWNPEISTEISLSHISHPPPQDFCDVCAHTYLAYFTTWSCLHVRNCAIYRPQQSTVVALFL